MGDLVLGPVVFHGFEIPERIQFGGRQRLVSHALTGGGRVVQVMGDDDAPVCWSGVFSGPDAASRVRLLERLRRAGDVLLLTWGGWRYSVVLEAFEVEGVNPAWMPYRLRACVVASGDVATLVEAGFSFVMAEALALGAGLAEAGAALDERIDAAGMAMSGGDVATAIAAAGTLAQLVTARAVIGNIS